MMTDEQVEAAARELCRLRDVDPDEMVGHGSGPGGELVGDVLQRSPKWRLVVHEVRAHEQVEAAIQAGRQTRVEGQP